MRIVFLGYVDLLKLAELAEIVDRKNKNRSLFCPHCFTKGETLAIAFLHFCGARGRTHASSRLYRQIFQARFYWSEVLSTVASICLQLVIGFTISSKFSSHARIIHGGGSSVSQRTLE